MKPTPFVLTYLLGLTYLVSVSFWTRQRIERWPTFKPYTVNLYLRINREGARLYFARVNQQLREMIDDGYKAAADALFANLSRPVLAAAA